MPQGLWTEEVAGCELPDQGAGSKQDKQTLGDKREACQLSLTILSAMRGCQVLVRPYPWDWAAR